MIALRILQRPDGAPAGPDVYTIRPEGSMVGRSPECDVVFDDPQRMVSRRHVWIVPEGPDLAMVRCLSTIAMMLVNEEPLAAAQERLVRGGDRLRIGGFDVLVETRLPPTPLGPLHLPELDPARSPAPGAGPPAFSKTATEPREVQAAERPPRLDKWFNLETVPDPMGPASPLPPLAPATPAAADPAQPNRSFSPAPPASPARRDSAWVKTQMLAPPAEQPAEASPRNRLQDDPAALAAAWKQAFLRGARLPSATPLAMDAAWMEHLGNLIRVATEGTMALLHSRAATKRNIRAKGTGIAVRENNLLKFAPDAAEALKVLLSAESRPGFLDPLDAMQAAHTDLQVHQLAMVAGMRAALFELITRLGPDAVEAAADPPSGLARWLPALRDAQLWRRHRQAHAQLMDNLDDAFELAFGREFVRAYEAQAEQQEAVTELPLRKPPQDD